VVFDRKKYQYRAGRSFPVAAQAAGEEIEKLGANTPENPVTPDAVVEAAAPETSPLHPCFEWDDAAAANEHRRDTARRLIRSLVVVKAETVEERPKVSQAFVSIGTSGRNGSSGYVAVEVAMSDEEMRNRVLRDALAQLRGWRARYGHIEELAPVVRAIDAANPLAVAV
jgi:hypothetical protein